MLAVAGAVLAPPIWGAGVSEEGPVTIKLVGHMYKHAVFDIKPHTEF